MLAACAALAGGCGAPDETPPEAGLPRVFVSIEPQAFFVERLAGALVQVEVLVPPAASPATYEVTPRQMERLSRAALYLRIGMPFERALLPRVRANCPNLRLHDLREGIELLALEDHSHEGHEGHSHGNEDPHVWLDPVRAKQLAANTAQALTALLPESKAGIDANLTVLKSDLDAARTVIAKTLAPVRGRTLYVYHPAYGYFADRFGLRQAAIEQEGKSPSLGNVQAIAGAIRREQAKALFVQPQFSTDTAEAVAQAAGVEVVRLDPLARDYIANLKRMAERVRKALGAGEE